MLCAAALGLCVVLGVAGLPNSASTRCVLVDRRSPPAFLSRVQGQLSDTSWRGEGAAGHAQRCEPRSARARLTRNGDDFELVFEAPDGRRFRRVLTGLGVGAAALEAAALALRSALLALDAGETPEMALVEPTSPVPPVNPWGLRGAIRAEHGGLDGPTAGVDLGLFRRLGPVALDFGVTLRLPQTVEDDLTRSELMRYEWAVGVRADAPLGERWGLAGALQGGVALWRRSTRAASPRAQPLGGGGTRWGALVRAQVTAVFRLMEAVGLEASLGLDGLTPVPRYLYRGERAEVVAEPWPIQPWLSFGVRWDPTLFQRP